MMAQHDSGYHLLFFHADGLKRREGDLIYRIQYKEGDGEIYLYLLLEFQSRPDKWMALRVLVYVGLLYQHLIKEGQLNHDSSLPPVFPLVLYNGDQPWHYAQDLQSLMALPPHSPLRKWQAQIVYYLLDESQYPTGKAGSIASTLFRIENTQDISDLRETLKILAQQIPMVNASLRRAFLSWICHVIAPHKGLQLETRDAKDLVEVREMLSTRIKQWEKEIEEKGLLVKLKRLKKCWC